MEVCSFMILRTASMRWSSVKSLRINTLCTAFADAGNCVVHIIASSAEGCCAGAAVRDAAAVAAAFGCAAARGLMAFGGMVPIIVGGCVTPSTVK